MANLKPWSHGLFEQIKHAEELLQTGRDSDKRLALIGFDNSIEASIQAYIKLHPSQRGGQAYKKEDVAQWEVNYHTKLDFFYKHLASLNLPIKIAKEEIIWYHKLRNELYHSGHGMVPEEYSIRGIREAAIWVFSVLYDVDTEALIQASIPENNPRSALAKPRPVKLPNKEIAESKITDPKQPPSTGWMPISKLSKGSNKPTTLKFPDGTTVSTGFTYIGALKQVAEWLIKTQKLPQVPIENHARGKKYLINTSPVHKSGNPFENSYQLSNGYYLDTYQPGDNFSKSISWLLQLAGENPDNYFFQ